MKKRGLAIAAISAAGALLWLGVDRQLPPVPVLPLAIDTLSPAPVEPVRLRDESELFRAAAERAWGYVERHIEPGSGLVRTVPDYPVATVWDIASGLAALLSAHELDLIADSAFDVRLNQMLQTLTDIPLFDRAAFNKTYATTDGRMLARDDSASARGFGWSAIDLGRLLVWLRITAERQPGHAAAVERVVSRLDLSRIVRDGYLHGEDLDRRGRSRVYQEGSLGYEQYAARGFALWGHRAERALSLATNGEALELLGEPILVDRRPRSCLTSEPFVLEGLELGWSDDAAKLAGAVLRVQQARFRMTGELTMASEDASTQPPFHFYYYCLHADAGPFEIVAPGGMRVTAGPRTVSAKAAFAWYALFPNEYTGAVLSRVAEVIDSAGTLIAGLEESSGRPMGPPNVNTAAVILEAAAFLRRGRPLIQPGPDPSSGPARR